MTPELKAVCGVLGFLAAFGLIYWWAFYQMAKANKVDAGTDVLEEMRDRLAEENAKPAFGGTWQSVTADGGVLEKSISYRATTADIDPKRKPPKAQTTKSAPKRKPSQKAKVRKKA